MSELSLHADFHFQSDFIWLYGANNTNSVVRSDVCKPAVSTTSLCSDFNIVVYSLRRYVRKNLFSFGWFELSSSHYKYITEENEEFLFLHYERRNGSLLTLWTVGDVSVFDNHGFGRQKISGTFSVVSPSYFLAV